MTIDDQCFFFTFLGDGGSTLIPSLNGDFTTDGITFEIT